MRSELLLSFLKQNPFGLAPMAGITDCALRSFMREMGAGIVVTELVSATGLRYSSKRTRELMKFEDVQKPIGVQLFGENLDDLSFAAKEVEQMGADFVDLNFGCPVPKVVKKGAGSAVLKDLKILREVLRTVVGSVSIPVTIKVRTGWDQATRNTLEVAHVAAEEGVLWTAIHGRTRAQGYSGDADWNYISEVKKQSPMPILGNGDLTSANIACSRLKESNCDGVLIGRGCLKNPWIFRESLQLWQTGEKPVIQKDFISVLVQLRHHLERTQNERLVGLQLKKFSAWFSSGYPGSSQFRKEVFAASQIDEICRITSDYFEGIKDLVQADTSDEPFLMGGHG